MKSSITLLLLLSGTSVFAADAQAPKYAPTIIGRLTNAGRPVALNVCLRSDGSEIRQCAYPDFDGRFYLPRLGAVQPKRVDTEDKQQADTYPMQWLEIGARVTDAGTKVYPITLVDTKTVVIRLDCDMARQAGRADDDASTICEIAPEHPQAAAQARR